MKKYSTGIVIGFMLFMYLFLGMIPMKEEVAPMCPTTTLTYYLNNKVVHKDSVNKYYTIYGVELPMTADRDSHAFVYDSLVIKPEYPKPSKRSPNFKTFR